MRKTIIFIFSIGIALAGTVRSHPIRDCIDSHSSDSVETAVLGTLDSCTVVLLDDSCGLHPSSLAEPDSTLLPQQVSQQNDSVDDAKKQTHRFEPHQGFVLIRDFVPDVIEDIRYYTTNNFMGQRADGYQANVAIISRQAALQLKAAADELRTMGYVIKIFDAYRPQSAVDHFVRWSKTRDQRNKADYYPDLEKSSLFPTYIAKKSGHTKGSTIDMTICYKDTKQEVDMGSHFDYFGQASHTMFLGKYNGGRVTKQHQANRLLLRNVMIKHGFKPYDNEWWHFTLKNQPYPDTYFNFPVSDH